MHLIRLIIISLGLIGSAFAMPPVEILQSCKNTKPANDKILLNEIPLPTYIKDTEPNCRERFETRINASTYGWGICDDKAHFIIANKEINLELAQNYSINPSIKPGAPIIQTASWWRIDKDKKSYICVISPLSNTGSGTNSLQYYLIEDAFDSKKTTYPIYFYFFDRQISKLF